MIEVPILASQIPVTAFAHGMEMKKVKVCGTC